jgi:teichoic acid transport system ATP-binding protein
VVKAGDLVRVAMRVKARREIEHLIVGVSVSDKYGQNVFGVNSLASGHGPMHLPMGARAIVVEFEWPEVKEGSYFLTLGLGEGLEELNHVVQCWAHNVVVLQAIPTRAIHGLFNVTMRKLATKGA